MYFFLHPDAYGPTSYCWKKADEVYFKKIPSLHTSKQFSFLDPQIKFAHVFGNILSGTFAY